MVRMEDTTFGEKKAYYYLLLTDFSKEDSMLTSWFMYEQNCQRDYRMDNGGISLSY